jgi:hypothetical protein
MMPSGYEKSPDYGGPEPTWRGMLTGLLIFAAVAALILFAAVR